MPSRSRPDAARAALDSFYETAVGEETRLIVIPDAQDPEYGRYLDVIPGRSIAKGQVGTMVARTNAVAKLVAPEDPEGWIGWMADDNRMRTPGWDAAIPGAVEPVVSMGDGFWSRRGKPVNFFWPTPVVTRLGWLALPSLRHLYVDDSWRMLAITTDSYVHLESLLCEHLHPAMGKGQWDDQYHSTENAEMYEHDRNAFLTWLQAPGGFERDRELVRQGLHQFLHQ